MELNILIVEDDPLFAVELEMLLKELGYTAITRVDNSAEALEICLVDKPDFVLMDIEIEGKLSGTEIAERIKHLDIPILFITSFGDEENYEKALQTNMVGYLVKPLRKYSLKSAIDLAFRSLKKVGIETPKEETKEDFIWDNYLFFKKKEAFIKVKIDDIAYLEANDDYVNVYTISGEKFTIRMRLSYFEKELSYEKFMRVHRSYIVQLEKVDSVNFQNNTLSIIEHTISMSRVNRDIIQSKMRKFK